MSEEIILKHRCKDCKYSLLNEHVSLCKINCELFNPNGLTSCLLFKGKVAL